MSFTNFGVNDQIVKGLKEVGVNTPTAIQRDVLPLLLNESADLFALAQTGSGKTLAFSIPLISKIDSNKGLQALIIVPTRELAQQVKKAVFKATKYLEHKIFVEAVYGGTKIEDQEARLQKPTHIIVATPGRLLDLLERNSIQLTKLKYLVLDEADEMINMGFRPDLNRMIKYMPNEKQVWMFSATLPEELRSVVKKFLRSDYHKIETSKTIEINPNIKHCYKRLAASDKFNYLLDFIDSREGGQGILFVRTKANAQKLAEALQEEGISSRALEGNMGQRDRDKVMRSFKNGASQILVATDVAARGLDIDDLSFVIHHQLPDQAVFYPHRSGRTARAGKKGLSLALVSPREEEDKVRIEKTFGISFEAL